MKLLQDVQKHGMKLGIRRLRPNETSEFNPRNVTFLIIFGLYFASSTAFLVFDANTFRSYTVCFFVWMTLLVMIIGFLIMTLKSPDMLLVLDKVEKTIENGKMNCSTMDFNQIN